MKNRKRAGVPKRGSARKTKAPASRAVKAPGHQERPKPSEGGRPFRSPFHTEWKYLNVGDLTARDPVRGNDGRAEGEKAKTGHETVRAQPSRSGRPAASRGVTYFEPPKPWQQKTDKEVLAWLREQDDEYQAHVDRGVAAWLSLKKWKVKYPERSEAEWARVYAERPDVKLATDEELITYVRKLSAPMCSCGFDGSPRSLHSLSYQCLKTPSPYAEAWKADDEDDDDLPF